MACQNLPVKAKVNEKAGGAQWVAKEDHNVPGVTGERKLAVEGGKQCDIIYYRATTRRGGV